MSAAQLTSRWLPVGLWMMVIFILSSRPDLPMPDDDMWSDVVSIVGHLSVYAVLMTLVLRAVRGGLRRVTAKQALIAFAATMLYAVTDEVHQTFVPGRTYDALDLLFDAVGATVALAAWYGLSQNKYGLHMSQIMRR